MTWTLKFHCYCFAYEINVIINYKLLVAIFKKDTPDMSYGLQKILLQIYPVQFQNTAQATATAIHHRLGIRYSHEINGDKGKPAMHININTIESCRDIPDRRRNKGSNLRR